MLNIIFIIAGSVVVWISSAYVVKSLKNIAAFFGVSSFVISFVLMSIATTLPELIVGINAAFSGSSELSLGNVIGTNIVNLSLIMGLVAFIAGRVTLNDYHHFAVNRLFNFFLIISPILLLTDGALSRIDGLILLGLTGWSFWRVMEFREKFKGKTFRGILITTWSRTIKGVSTAVKGFFNNLSIFILSVIFLILASFLLVEGAKNISLELGMSEVLVGIFIIAIGTSLPELVFGIRSALRKQGDMSLGNLLGAAVLNSTLVLGITALISPIFLTDRITFLIGVMFMTLSVVLVYWLLQSKNVLVRREGLALIIFYGAFILLQSQL